MSVSRVKYHKQFFPITSYSYDSSTRTISVIANNHVLYTGVTASLTSDKDYYVTTGTATKTSANTFTIVAPFVGTLSNEITHYSINGYVTGQTGVKDAQTLPRATGTDTIIQSYVIGTGAASYNIDVSLDKEHWIPAANVVHTTTSGDTGFITIKPGWAFMRANVVSIGANSNLVLMTGE